MVYLNGWVALYQFLVSLPFAFPSAVASNIHVKDIPKNLWDGAKCSIGINSIMNATSIAQKDDCGMAPEFVSIYLVFNLICMLNSSQIILYLSRYIFQT